MHLLALVIPLPILLATAIAQTDPVRPAEKPGTKAPFVFEPGVVEVHALIERCGTYLQRNILVDDSELQTTPGKRPRAAPAAAGGAAAGAPAGDGPTGPFVELQLPVVTDRDGCEELLTSLLWTRGLALVPLDEAKAVYEVLSMNGPRAREIAMRAVQRTAEQVLARPTLRQCVTVAVTLQHTNGQLASNALRPFFASQGNSNGGQLNVGNLGNTTSVLLNGPQDQVANALLILRAADVPQPPEVRPEWMQRLDSLAKQNEQLEKRLAALEEKAGKNR